MPRKTAFYRKRLPSRRWYTPVVNGAGAALTLGSKYWTGRPKTKPKKKVIYKSNLYQKAKHTGHGGSISSFYYGKRKMPIALRKLRGAISKNYYATNSSARVTGTAGAQQATLAMTMFNNQDITTISNKISNNKTNKFALLSCSAEVMFTNQDQGNCRFTIYDIVARRDLSTQSDPLSAWQASYFDEGGANANWNIVGVTPFSSDVFTQFFKVCKITNGILSQGQSHNHKVHFSPNRFVDEEYITNVTNGYRGLTVFTMIVFHGEPYNDSITKTQVSTGQTVVDIVQRRQYKYTWISDNDTSFYVYNNLPTTFTNNESIMDIGSGVTTNDTPA